MPMNSKEMIRFLKRNGFVEIKGGKGSHRRLKNFATGKVTEVPCHSKELGKILEKVILKEAGLKNPGPYFEIKGGKHVCCLSSNFYKRKRKLYSFVS